MADKNAKAQIDIVANPKELSPELQKAEKDINTFGQKISTIFDRVSEHTASLKESIVKTFSNSVSAVQSFTASLRISETAINLYNQILLKSQGYLAQYSHALIAASESHKVLARTNKLTGETAGFATEKLAEYASYLSKITKFSATATEGAMNLVMHFRNIHGDEFVRATRASQDLATELKMDLASAAQFVGEALNDPINAVGKLSSANIFLTENEKKLVEKFMKANNVIAAQQVILAKLESSFAGAAEAAGNTLVGKLERLKNTITQVGVAIGQKLLEKLNQISSSTREASKGFDSFLQKVEEWGAFVIAAIDTVIPKVIEFTQTININFGAVYDWLIDATVTTFTAVQTIYENFSEMMASTGTFIFNVSTKIWGGICTIFTDVLPAALHYSLEVIKNFGQQLWNNLKAIAGKFSIFWGNIKTLGWTTLTNLLVFVEKTLVKIEKFLISRLAGIVAKIPGIGTMMMVALNQMEEEIDKKLDDLKIKAINPFQGTMGQMPGFQDIFKVEGDDAEKALSKMKEGFDLGKEWKEVLEDANKNFGEGFSENVEKNKTAFNNLITEIKNKPKTAFKAPKMEPTTKRKDDEKKKESKAAHTFESGLVGLEDLWRNMSSGGVSSPETLATEANTKALEENTKTVKKTSEEQKSAKHKTAEHEKLVRKYGEAGAKAKEKAAQEAKEKEEKDAKQRLNKPDATKKEVKTEVAEERKRQFADRLKKVNERNLAIQRKKYIKEKTSAGLTEGEAAESFAMEQEEAKKDRELAAAKRTQQNKTKRETAAKQTISRNNKRREFADSIKLRMGETGEKYVEARRNIERVRSARTAPADELAKSRQEKSNKQTADNKQHADTTKHLEQIAKHTRNTAQETQQSKELLQKQSKKTPYIV